MSDETHRKKLLSDAERVLGPAHRPTASERIPIEDIDILSEAGYSKQRIADYYGVDRSTIWRVQNSFGTKPSVWLKATKTKIPMLNITGFDHDQTKGKRRRPIVRLGGKAETDID